ncbi:hypothetical protein BH10BDE1_BH10BDE1_05540 [soil metagenome]
MKLELKDDVRTLLLIDDEPDIIEIVFAMLKRPHLHLLLANSGAEALAVLEKRPVDAILSDIRMPEMSGVAMVQEVRNRGFATPIVLMSGFADYGEILEALRVGVIDVVEKPFSKDRLVAAVKHAIEVGCSVRSIQSDLKRLGGDQPIDSKFVDILKSFSLYLSQEEVERARRQGTKAF